MTTVKEDFPVGTRVSFLGFGEDDPWSKLEVGTEGTVAFVDDLGTVHVNWDDGSTLGVVVDPNFLLTGEKPDRIVRLT